ncbi:hypothetical protein FGO68_gene12918 [Halteria grandinella]|uniref:Uncharacterized protein n=1 Tax=Halteria grandinella TaxID=5974 RepID=A0A8J8NNG3_HALGN|nr:hypothetical protein FGO68_gene12918 [Halteria grandinella]
MKRSLNNRMAIKEIRTLILRINQRSRVSQNSLMQYNFDQQQTIKMKAQMTKSSQKQFKTSLMNSSIYAFRRET